jgi:excisionase family DNA binding protein
VRLGTAKQAAELLGVSRSTLYSRVRAGLLPGVYVPSPRGTRAPRFRLDVIEELLIEAAERHAEQRAGS